MAASGSKKKAKAQQELEALRERWHGAWQGALEAWSSFTKLAAPRWCLTIEDEEREDLTGSFAMIRLVDHAVVISIRQVKELGLEDFATEVLAHEIGHHVYAPGDLSDNARLQAHIRAALPGYEKHAGLVANLYTDLLINDRLQRGAELDMAGVYARLKPEAESRLWTFYMRTYEILWRLQSQTLIVAEPDAQIQSDAMLGARVIRAYSKHWLEGGGRFASLCLSYLLDMPEDQAASSVVWLDATQAGKGGEIPDGLVSMDGSELGGVIHPDEDEALTGLKSAASANPSTDAAPEIDGGLGTRFRSPPQYTELMQSLGVEVSPADLVIRYYRERARPYLIKFPVREVQRSTDPLPEGFDIWDVGSAVSAIDWVESVVRSPVVIPGVTTVERVYGTTEGERPIREPVDLYLGVDCSGSMTNPSRALSYPVLAGTIMTASAIRAGAQVMTVLSGEPGQYTSTDGYSRSEKNNLGVLTSYLGTGYAYGIMRLKDAFLDATPTRPVHIMIISDNGWFMMLKSLEKEEGWEIARRAAEVAGGGATALLDASRDRYLPEDVERLRTLGWDIHFVKDQASLVGFARAFSKTKYETRRLQ